MEGSKNFKSRSRHDPFAIPFDLIWHFFDSAAVPPVLNLFAKVDANDYLHDYLQRLWLDPRNWRYINHVIIIIIGDQYNFTTLPIWLRNDYSRPFWGDFLGFDPLNVVGYCRDPKRHILGRKHAFWRTDRANLSRNEIWSRAKESKKDKKLRDVTSHIFAQTTHVALSAVKLSFGVGSRT